MAKQKQDAENLPAPTEKNVVVTTLQNKRDDLLQLLPRQMRTPAGVDRLLRVTTACILANAELKKCTPTSLVAAVVAAAQLGLEPTGQYGGAYLVPFKNKKFNPETNREEWVLEAAMIPDYRGLLDIVRRSGQLKTIDAAVVYANDDFDFEQGLRPFLKHRRAWNSERGEIIGVWAAAVLMDGGEQFVVMDRREVDEIKSLSKGAKSSFSPWNTPVGYPEMMKKTALRRLCKLLPRSIELMDALRTADEIDPAEFARRETANVRSGLVALAGGQPTPANEPPPVIEGHAEELPSDDENARRVELAEALDCRWTEEGTIHAQKVAALRAAGATEIPLDGEKNIDLSALPSAVLEKALRGGE